MSEDRFDPAYRSLASVVDQFKRGLRERQANMILCPICGAEAMPQKCKLLCPFGHGIVLNCNGD